MRQFTGKCATKWHIIVAFLWEQERWVSAPEMVKLDTPYGFVGSAGDVRARELARNECPKKLKGKVERAEGRDIGLDKRFTYFRYKQLESRAAMLADNQNALDYFENYQSSAA
jgi:hypothetical protein